LKKRDLATRAGLVILVAIGLLSVIYYYHGQIFSQSTTSATTTSMNTNPYFVQGASALYYEYTANQAKADAEYTGTQAVFPVTVESITKDQNGHYATCTVQGEMDDLGCNYIEQGLEPGIVYLWAGESAASQVPIGQAISVQCAIDGLSTPNGGDPVLILSGCTIER
jgi:hypothetical protein